MKRTSNFTNQYNHSYKSMLMKAFPYLSFLLVTFLVVIFNRKYLLTDVDFLFHKYRLLGLVQSIQNGDIFPKINFILCNGHGYGVPMFYGQWWMYFPAALILAGVSFTGAWTATICVVYFVVCSINFIVAKKLGNDTLQSILLTMLFVFNPLATQIINGNIPFAICLYLTPALYYSLYKTLYKEQYNPIFLGIIVAIMVKSHVISTVISAIMVGIYLLLEIKKMTLQKLLTFVKSGFIALLISASFSIPMLEQLLAQKFHGASTRDTFRWSQIPEIFDIIQNSLSDTQNTISQFPQISLVGIILFILCLLQYRKLKGFGKKLLVLCIIVIVLSSNVFPWVFFGKTPLGIVQFVGRYLVFVMAILMLITMSYTTLSRRMILFLLALTASSTITHCILPSPVDEQGRANYNAHLTSQANSAYYHSLNSDVDDILQNNKLIDGILGGEYVNHKADLTELANDKSLMPYSNTVEISKIENSYNSIRFRYDGTGTITIPYLWYKGYRAEYSNGGHGTPTQIAENNNGYISINVEGHGDVEINYKWTFIQKITFAITITAILLCALYYCLRLHLKLKKRQ